MQIPNCTPLATQLGQKLNISCISTDSTLLGTFRQEHSAATTASVSRENVWWPFFSLIKQILIKRKVRCFKWRILDVIIQSWVLAPSRNEVIHFFETLDPHPSLPQFLVSSQNYPHTPRPWRHLWTIPKDNIFAILCLKLIFLGPDSRRHPTLSKLFDQRRIRKILVVEKTSPEAWADHRSSDQSSRLEIPLRMSTVDWDWCNLTHLWSMMCVKRRTIDKLVL